jgi:GNAT superfamily N-acetyltransferase
LGKLSLSPPRPIDAACDLSSFDSGVPSLDSWLQQRALRNESAGASRSYVVCEGPRVVGYYCLSSGAVECRQAPGRVRRNMPDPIPVMLLGRLAVDRAFQGQGLGRALLKDAILRTLKAAEIAGLRALLVHALDEEAARFYRRNGFLDSPIDPLLLMLPLATVRRALE